MTNPVGQLATYVFKALTTNDGKSAPQEPVSRNGFSLSKAASQTGRALKFLAAPFKRFWNKLTVPSSVARKERTEEETPLTYKEKFQLVMATLGFREYPEVSNAYEHKLIRSPYPAMDAESLQANQSHIPAAPESAPAVASVPKEPEDFRARAAELKKSSVLKYIAQRKEESKAP